MKKRRLLALLLAFVLMLPAVSVSAADYVGPPDGILDSGVCGTDLNWTVYTNGTLTITGTGEMYYYSSNAPWYDYCTSIKTVNLPEGLTSIYENAFFNCTALESISLPKSITSIDYRAFGECSALSSINIPEKVKKIGQYCFSGCFALTEIELPEGITEIPSSAFERCIGLKSINIPDSVMTIGAYAFFKCYELSPIDLPKNLTTIGWCAFSDCDSLSSITIPNTVTSIGSSAFDGCQELTGITIPIGITTIEDSTFDGCQKLTNVTIPKSVTSIENDAFNYCNALKDVYYEGSKTDWNSISIGYRNDPLKKATFHYNTAIPMDNGNCGETLTWVLDSQGTLTIRGTGAMSRYSSGHAPWYKYADQIKTLVIEEGLTSIGQYAFCNCTEMTTAYLPYSLSNFVDKYAFNNTPALTEVHYNGTKNDFLTRVKSNTQGNNGSFTKGDYVHPLMAEGIGGTTKAAINATTSLGHFSTFEGIFGPHNITALGASDVKLVFTLDSFDKKSAADGNTFEITVKLDNAKFITSEKVALTEKEAISMFSITRKDTSSTLAPFETDFVPVGYEGWKDMAAGTLNVLESSDVLLNADISDDHTEIKYTVFTGKNAPIGKGSKISINLQSMLTKTDVGTEATVTVSGDVCDGDKLVYCTVVPDIYAIDSLKIREKKTGGTYLDAIPEAAFVAEVQLTTGFPAHSNQLVLAGYDTDGRMVYMKPQSVSMTADYHSTYTFDVSNTEGNITELRAFFTGALRGGYAPLAKYTAFPAA